MPVTDMKFAAITEGSLVNVIDPKHPGSMNREKRRELAQLRKLGPWIVSNLPTDGFRRVALVNASDDQLCEEVEYQFLERDCDDAQRVRHENFGLIADAYPIEVEPAIGPSDTLPRYVCITLTMGAWNHEVPRDHRTVDYMFPEDGTLTNVLEEVSELIWGEGLIPIDFFDLDQGKEIFLHYASPHLGLSSDQHACIDVLATDSYDGDIDDDLRERLLQSATHERPVDETSFRAGVAAALRMLGGNMSLAVEPGEMVERIRNSSGILIEVDGRTYTTAVDQHNGRLAIKPIFPTPVGTSIAAAEGHA